MSISEENLQLILTRARLMSMQKRSAVCRDYAMRNLYEGDVVSCWTDGDVVRPIDFKGGYQQLFFISYSTRHSRFMGVSPEFSWVCTPTEFFGDRCIVVGDVFENTASYLDYLKRAQRSYNSNQPPTSNA